MRSINCKMNNDEKLEFWQVESDASSRKMATLFLLLSGIALIGASLIFGQLGFWTTLVISLAIASVGVSSGCADPNWKPPEPKLELVDEKYRIKATGKDGIDALTLIAAFREQEDRKAQRFLVWIGAAFGFFAIGSAFHPDGLLPSLISGAFALAFVAWAMRIKQLQIQGLGVGLNSTND